MKNKYETAVYTMATPTAYKTYKSNNGNKASFQIVSIASSLAGIVEAISVQPFDMVKTRQQLNKSVSPPLFRCFMDIYSEGGMLRFYRGLLPELIGFIPKTNAQYFAYEYSRRYLSKILNHGECHWIICAISGFIAGYATALTVTPSQVIKVRLQSTEYLTKYSNTFDCYSRVIRNQGMSALMIGLGPTIWRNSTWNTIYFGLMYYVKHNILREVEDKHTAYALSQTLISGFVGGSVATLFNAPFDVVKSRVQEQNIGDVRRNRFTLVALYEIYKCDGGIRGCYKGIKPKIIRMGLGGAVSMTTFEFICNLNADKE